MLLLKDTQKTCHRIPPGCLYAHLVGAARSWHTLRLHSEKHRKVCVCACGLYLCPWSIWSLEMKCGISGPSIQCGVAKVKISSRTTGHSAGLCFRCYRHTVDGGTQRPGPAGPVTFTGPLNCSFFEQRCLQALREKHTHISHYE